MYLNLAKFSYSAFLTFLSTVTPEGKERSACIACQSPCIDIDAEQSYWKQLSDPRQQWLYYGYVGLVVGYFLYYYFYSGNWEYYLSGVWAHEEEQLMNLFNPGFYFFGQEIGIPKIIAAPLTLAAFGVGGYYLGRKLEKWYKAYQIRKYRPLSTEKIRHRCFTLSTFLIFNFFFVFAGHNFIELLPRPLPFLFPILVGVCSTLWLDRTWQRSASLYTREGLATRLRKQLRQLNLDGSQFLEGRTLDDLNANEIYVLAKVLPGFSKEKRLQAYQGIVRESIQQGLVAAHDTLRGLQLIGKELHLSDFEHDQILTEVGQQSPELFQSNPERN